MRSPFDAAALCCAILAGCTFTAVAGTGEHSPGRSAATGLSVANHNPPTDGWADIVVDREGKGDFTSIQDAIESAGPYAGRPVTIFVRNGLYREKIFISRSGVTLAGEDRDSTRIVFAELRENWNREHGGSDRGSGVVNIDTGTADITIANMTIFNNYGSMTGAYNKHQFAIRGAGTRIMLISCNVISDGGDAVSLWNREDGMYYHTDCRFEGWVDFVCPRGWCYISDSRFFGHNTPSASIWHDGSADEDQKFVIVNSFFDGVSGFPLGRNHLDAQFYLVGCRFSGNMLDRPFFRPPSSPRPWKWGDRHYFHNCHRDGGDYAWFGDNLATAKGSPSPESITAKWTFGGRWDPEAELPEILPRAYLPDPRRGEEMVSEGSVTLSWVRARNARSQRLSFGAEKPPPFTAAVGADSFTVGGLHPATTYYWRIDAVTDTGTVTGETWKFRTRESPGRGTIVVRNPLDLLRRGEPVVISWDRLKTLAGVQTPSEISILDGTGEEVDFQADDMDSDGAADEIVFVTDLGPLQEKQFSVTTHPSRPPRATVPLVDAQNYKRVDGMLTPVDDDDQPGAMRDRKAYRFDGVGWESTVSAYRLYLDGRNAVDIQGKRREGLHWKWIGESGVDYQLDAPWGMDVLHVGPALGLGGIGFWVNDTLSKPWKVNNQRCRIVSRGPVRSVVRVEYRGWGVGNGKTDVTSVFSIYAGERITEHRVTVGGSMGHPLATGIVRHDSASVTWDPNEGRLVTTGRQSRSGDSLLLALRVPPDRVIARKTDTVDELLLLDAPAGGTLSIMIASFWQGEGDRRWNSAEIDRTLETMGARISDPPVVELLPEENTPTNK